MPERINLFGYPAEPPPLKADGEPIACPRCGMIFERPLPGIPGHPIGHPKLCPPMVGYVNRDARYRHNHRPGPR
jgi:hypothetical protein